MAFPTSPSEGTTHSVGDRSYVYQGGAWVPAGSVDTPESVSAALRAAGGYLEYQTLADAATIAMDASLGVNAKVVLGADARVLGLITNAASGETGIIEVDNAGGFSMTGDAAYKVVAGSFDDIVTYEYAFISYVVDEQGTLNLWISGRVAP